MNWWALLLMVLTAAAIGAILWWGRAVMRDHPVRAVAVVCVAIIGGFVMWMGWLHTEILSSPDWCGKAIQAEKISPGTTFVGLTTCVELLKIQLQAEATNSHIYASVIGGCLLALIVIVIAQGRAQISAPGGFGGTFGPGGDPAEAAKQAANQVAGAANDEAIKVTDAANVAEPSHPEYKGPAMPEPPAKGS